VGNAHQFSHYNYWEKLRGKIFTPVGDFDKVDFDFWW